MMTTKQKYGIRDKNGRWYDNPFHFENFQRKTCHPIFPFETFEWASQFVIDSGDEVISMWQYLGLEESVDDYTTPRTACAGTDATPTGR